MATQPKITKAEQEWMAEDDARILVEAEKIKNDPNRLEKAKKMANKMSEKIAEDAKALKKLTSKKTNKKPTKKGKK